MVELFPQKPPASPAGPEVDMDGVRTESGEVIQVRVRNRPVLADDAGPAVHVESGDQDADAHVPPDSIAIDTDAGSIQPTLNMPANQVRSYKLYGWSTFAIDPDLKQWYIGEETATSKERRRRDKKAKREFDFTLVESGRPYTLYRKDKASGVEEDAQATFAETINPPTVSEWTKRVKAGGPAQIVQSAAAAAPSLQTAPVAQAQAADPQSGTLPVAPVLPAAQTQPIIPPAAPVLPAAPTDLTQTPPLVPPAPDPLVAPAAPANTTPTPTGERMYSEAEVKKMLIDKYEAAEKQYNALLAAYQKQKHAPPTRAEQEALRFLPKMSAWRNDGEQRVTEKDQLITAVLDKFGANIRSEADLLSHGKQMLKKLDDHKEKHPMGRKIFKAVSFLGFGLLGGAAVGGMGLSTVFGLPWAGVFGSAATVALAKLGYHRGVRKMDKSPAMRGWLWAGLGGVASLLGIGGAEVLGEVVGQVPEHLRLKSIFRI